MASDAPVTQRVIISGLTPAITVQDLTRRLGSFGTVKAADGFGLTDGLDQPRKFGFVTLETTTSKLARCMNLLSGSTWKGAKLRFGFAKPDYRERIALENQKAAEQPPKKKRRVYGAVHADDMSPISSENASERPGWKVSSLGRITHPIKTRPLHPLPEVQQERIAVTKTTKKEETKKRKKRPRDPDTRARRKTIDMQKWGSTHLKGIFLDLEVDPSQAVSRAIANIPSIEDYDISSESESESEAETSSKSATTAQKDTDDIGVSVSKLSILEELEATNTKKTESSSPSKLDLADLQAERTQTLALLSSLFGTESHGDDVDDWVGRESIDSDIDADKLIKGDIVLDDADDDIEIVPRSFSIADSSKSIDDGTNVAQPAVTANARPITEAHRAQKKLKDLFAPREEEAGFSLLGHLDLDVEFDDDVNLFLDQEAPGPSIPTPDIIPNPSASSYSSAPKHPIVLDPKKPLFFPLSHSDKSDSRKPRPKDIFDVFEEHGCGWRDPSVKFWKTETDEDIRKQWEETRVDLTRDWKKRWREAGKARKKKKGGEMED